MSFFAPHPVEYPVSMSCGAITSYYSTGRAGQVLWACYIAMIQEGACPHLSLLDLEKWESPLKQHAPGPDLAR